MGTGDKHEKFGEDRPRSLRIMRANRQTDTQTQTPLIAILRTPPGGGRGEVTTTSSIARRRA